MRGFLKNILPDSIIQIYKRIKKNNRSRTMDALKEKGQILKQSAIKDSLKDLGIHDSDIVMLHSSLSKMGFVEGGAKTIVDSFLATIGDNGTLVMPSFPAIGYNYDYLMSDPIFDIKNTPSKMGAVTEYFRNLSNVKRSFHPTDPVVAFGPKSEYITQNHYNQITPYNDKSPFFRLCELNAKIVLIGVELDSLTNLHTLEDAVSNFKFPVYHSRIFDCRMIDWNGNMVRVKTKVHDPKWSKQRRCNELKEHFIKAGFMKEGKLGLANIYVIEADKMHTWMVKNYLEKGITMYNPHGS